MSDDNIFPNPISDWYDRNEKRVFTMPEVMALVDEMSISSGATRETIDYMDREYADNDTYIWRRPHFEPKDEFRVQFFLESNNPLRSMVIDIPVPLTDPLPHSIPVDPVFHVYKITMEHKEPVDVASTPRDAEPDDDSTTSDASQMPE